jgi:hypothetical protein
VGDGTEVLSSSGGFEGPKLVQERPICHWLSRMKVCQGEMFGLGEQNR